MTSEITTTAKILKVRFPNLTVTEVIELSDTILSALRREPYSIGDVDTERHGTPVTFLTDVVQAVAKLQEIVDASPFLAAAPGSATVMRVVTSDHVDDWYRALSRK